MKKQKQMMSFSETKTTFNTASDFAESLSLELRTESKEEEKNSIKKA